MTYRFVVNLLTHCATYAVKGDRIGKETTCLITQGFIVYFDKTIRHDMEVSLNTTVTTLNCMFLFVGQERFTSMTRVYYKDAHACIIMFDLTQQSTFQNAVKWKKDLDTKCSLADGSPIPCLLLANKVLYN